MKNSKAKKVLIGTLIVIFLAAGFQLVNVFLENRQGAEIYDNASDEYVSEEKTETTALAAPVEIDFKTLNSLNDDIKGWLWIEDSKINYPLLQGADNQKYLNYTFDGTANKLGSVFMDYRCLTNFDGYNTIIYAHNMLTDDMFGTLEKYEDPVYTQEHKFIYVITDKKTHKYEIFSAYITDAYGDTYTYAFPEPNAYSEYLIKMKNQSLFDTGVEIGEEDKILTLSTCTSSNKKTERFVVQAKEIVE